MSTVLGWSVLYFGVGTALGFSVTQVDENGIDRGSPFQVARLVEAVYFLVVTLTSVGYGDMAPKSPELKLCTAVLIACGSGFVMIWYMAMLEKQWRRVENIIITDWSNRRKKRIRMATAVIVVVVVIGIVGVFNLEAERGPEDPMGLAETIYLVIATVSTVGFGDHHFKTMGGRVFAIFWIFLGTPLVNLAVQVLHNNIWQNDPRNPYPVLSDRYLDALEKCRRDLRVLISENQCALSVIRLAGFWAHKEVLERRRRVQRQHTMGIEQWRQQTDKRVQLPRTENTARFLLEPLKMNVGITYSDFYQLAGIVAVEVSGGPQITFHPGRKDVLRYEADDPQIDIAEFKQFFYSRGFEDSDIVALLGGCTLDYRFKGPWTKTDYIFDNREFADIGRRDYRDQLPLDSILIRDHAFNNLAHQYSQDNHLFADAYATAHSKLSEIGLLPPGLIDDETIERCRAKLRALIASKGCAPLVLRLAGYSACTTGGHMPQSFMAIMPISGLDIAARLLEPFTVEFGQLSHADLYQLAGLAALDITGGPSIPFRLGRPDPVNALVRAESSRDRLYGLGQARTDFANIGLTDNQIIALYGGQSLVWSQQGESHIFEGPLQVPFRFSNFFFRGLAELEKNLRILMVDEGETAVYKDILKTIERYERSGNAFYADFAESYLSFSELGWI